MHGVAGERLRFAGLHCHIGSQIFVLESYARAVGAVCLKIEFGLSKHYNIFGAQGAKAWQTVFHHHLHIIPRYGKEKQWDWPAGKLTKEDAEGLLYKMTE